MITNIRFHFTALAVASLAAISHAEDARKPNILLIVADDLGWGETGFQGNTQIPTPNLDSLAKNGTKFTSGYVSGPYCSPTRAALLTGRYQQRFGHEFNPGRAAATGFGLPLSEKTLPEHLKEAGYATGMFGKWHLGNKPEFHPTRRGFGEYYGFLAGAHSYLKLGAGNNALQRGEEPVSEIDYTTEAFAREASTFIDKHQANPWFVYLPFNAVHGPLESTEKYLSRFQHIEDNKRRTFAAMLSAMDDAVGSVLAKLRELKQEENTLIFFFSDNGGPTRQTTSSNGPLNGFKAQVWEGGIRVPFVAQWKGRLPAGQVYDHPVNQIDVHPTLLAAAGVSTTQNTDGVNLLPYLSGEKKDAPHSALFWRFGPQRAVRSGDWKLTNTGDGTKLFNLKDDIGEKNDLAVTAPEKVKELELAYSEWNKLNVEPKWVPGDVSRFNKDPAKRKRRNTDAPKASATPDL
jgi:arylsulfatase A-like enzyme